MTVYGQIYSAFEDFMAVQLASSHVDPRMAKIYRSMYLSQLLRRSRLRSDIEVLKSRLRRGEAKDIEFLSKEAEVFCQRIKSSLTKKPHVLLAYAWTMYLALFNGGQWIRKQLDSAGAEFWLGEAFPLSFWEFAGTAHAHVEGEPLKDVFKTGFAAAASHLTDDERQDVVEEASQLFDLCSEMVGFLDRNAATKPFKEACPGSSLHLDSRGASDHLTVYAVTETVEAGLGTAHALLKTAASATPRDKLEARG
jgi:heme oxygenase